MPLNGGPKADQNVLARFLAPVTVQAAINDAIGVDKGRDPVADFTPAWNGRCCSPLYSAAQDRAPEPPQSAIELSFTV